MAQRRQETEPPAESPTSPSASSSSEGPARLPEEEDLVPLPLETEVPGPPLGAAPRESAEEREERLREQAGGRAPAAKRRHRRVERRPSLSEQLYEALGHEAQTMGGTPYYSGLAGALAIVDPFDGACIALNSRQVANAWGALAEQNERVRRLLEAALSGGAWGAALLATLTMLLPILVHHGLLPASVFHTSLPGEESPPGPGSAVAA